MGVAQEQIEKAENEGAGRQWRALLSISEDRCCRFFVAPGGDEAPVGWSQSEDRLRLVPFDVVYKHFERALDA